MSNMIGVRFESIGRVHYYNTSDLDLDAGDRVVVETEDGPREGSVVITPGQVIYCDLRGPMSLVLYKVKGD